MLKKKLGSTEEFPLFYLTLKGHAKHFRLRKYLLTYTGTLKVERFLCSKFRIPLQLADKTRSIKITDNFKCKFKSILMNSKNISVGNLTPVLDIMFSGI